MTLRSIFNVFEWKYCAVSEKVFSMSVIYLHFSHCKVSLFCEFIELGSKLGLQRSQFWSWLHEQQSPRNLRAWYIHLMSCSKLSMKNSVDPNEKYRVSDVREIEGRVKINNNNNKKQFVWSNFQRQMACYSKSEEFMPTYGKFDTNGNISSGLWLSFRLDVTFP